MRTGLALVGFAALVVAGCSPRVEHRGSVASGGVFNPGLYRSLLARTEPDIVDLNSPPVAALPMEAGRVVQVRSRRYANGLSQTIALAGDGRTRGENAIEVTMRTEAEGERYDNLVELTRPDAAAIEAELSQRFPGVDMRVTPYMLRNSYGPYGLALGRQGAGVTCAYVWQWIDDADSVSGLKSRHVTLHATETALRVRLCREGLSERQLAELASSLVIDRNGALAMPVAPGQGAFAAAPNDALSAAIHADQPGLARHAGFSGYRLPPAPSALAAAEARPQRHARTQQAPRPRKTRIARRLRQEAAPQQAYPASYHPAGQAAPYPAAYPAPAYPPAVPAAPYPGGMAPVPAGYPGAALPSHAGAVSAPPQRAPARLAVHSQAGVLPVSPGHDPRLAAQGPRGLDSSLPPQAYRGPSGPAEGSASPRGAVQSMRLR